MVQTLLISQKQLHRTSKTIALGIYIDNNVFMLRSIF